MLELEVLELEVQECWNLCLKWLEIDNGLRFLLLRKSFCVKVFVRKSFRFRDLIFREQLYL